MFLRSCKSHIFIIGFLVCFMLEDAVFAKGTDLVSELSGFKDASQEFVGKLERALRAFYVKRDYESAYRQLDEVIELTSDPTDKEVLFGLRNASLYTLGYH